MNADVAQARALLEIGRHHDAQRMLSQFLAGAPESVEAWCLLARAHQLDRQYWKMLDAANQAALTAPHSEWAHRLRSIALGKVRMLGESRAAAQRALELAPHAWQPYVILVDALLALGTSARRRQAFEAAARASQLAPHEPEVHNSRGRVYQAISDPASARRSYQEALRLDPQNITARNNLAVLELRRGRTTSAGGRLGEVLAERPTESLYQKNATAAAKVWAYQLTEFASAVWLIELAVAVIAPSWPVRSGGGLALLAICGYAGYRRYRRLSASLRRLVRINRWPLAGVAVQSLTALQIAAFGVARGTVLAALMPLLAASSFVALLSALRLKNRLVVAVLMCGRRWWYRLVVLRGPV